MVLDIDFARNIISDGAVFFVIGGEPFGSSIILRSCWWRPGRRWKAARTCTTWLSRSYKSARLLEMKLGPMDHQYRTEYRTGSAHAVSSHRAVSRGSVRTVAFHASSV